MKLMKERLPLIEKWLMLPKGYHWGLFALCLSAVNLGTVFESWHKHQQSRHMAEEITQQSAELAHQEKVLIALKQHSDKQELSPQRTKQIVALDQQIQGLLDDEISLDVYQWDFSARPMLQIQAEGRFQYLHHFLTALSTQNKLSFAQLDMQKMESGGVQMTVILQLNQEE